MRDPRARVFVLYLDVHHVRIHGSWNVREPLVRLIDRLLGPDDLVGVMTPHMSAKDIVFARRTEVLAGGLRDRWPWGERFSVVEDEKDSQYRACYPWRETEDVIRAMKARRREVIFQDFQFDLDFFARLHPGEGTQLHLFEGRLLGEPAHRLADKF